MDTRSPELPVTRFSFALAFALVAAAFMVTLEARADDLPGPAFELCTVNRKCSSTGIACAADDRTCTNDATARGLEIICEETGTSKRLVYCPPDTGRADSNVVWVLLGAAILLAIGGSFVAWLVLRKKA